MCGVIVGFRRVKSVMTISRIVRDRIYFSSPRNAENGPLLFGELRFNEFLVRILFRKM